MANISTTVGELTITAPTRLDIEQTLKKLKDLHLGYPFSFTTSTEIDSPIPNDNDLFAETFPDFPNHVTSQPILFDKQNRWAFTTALNDLKEQFTTLTTPCIFSFDYVDEEYGCGVLEKGSVSLVLSPESKENQLIEHSLHSYDYTAQNLRDLNVSDSVIDSELFGILLTDFVYDDENDQLRQAVQDYLQDDQLFQAFITMDYATTEALCEQLEQEDQGVYDNLEDYLEELDFKALFTAILERKPNA